MNISIPNCQQLQNIPYQEFWNRVKQINTPIVEPVENNPSFSRVTFLYQGNSETKNVVLGTYGLCSYDPKYDQLNHIYDTDIFYKTYVFPSNLKTIYCFSPNDVLLSMADVDLYNCDLLPMIKHWEPDSFNPTTYTLPGWLILGEEQKTFSLLRLPCAVDSEWSDDKKNVVAGTCSRYAVSSANADISRFVHIYKSSKAVSENYRYPVMIFFDGDAYIQYLSACKILDNLISAEKIPPVMAVFISNPEPNTVTRWHDLTCNESYISFIANDLIPWVHDHFPTSRVPNQNTIVGASWGGLAAMYLAFKYPNVVGNVISQSGAFFWRPKHEQEDGWLMKQLSHSPKLDLKINLDVGCVENALTFGKGASILNANRHMRDVLIAKGYQVTYQEYAGGHDYMCWQDILPEEITSVLNLEQKDKIALSGVIKSVF